MTQPPYPPPNELAYQSVQRDSNAPILVKLAGIFNMVSAGFDLLYGLGMLGLVLLVLLAPGARAVPPPRPGAAPIPRGHHEILAVAMVYGVPAALSLAAATAKFLGAMRLLRHGKNAWGWGLAIGIVGCVELWMFFPCCLPIVIPLAAGIYTIVIMCLPQVRGYLLTPQQPSIPP